MNYINLYINLYIMQFIYVIRHGETDANVNNQVNDKNVITPLNKNGKIQASKTGKYLKKEFMSGILKGSCIIYSSPSIRAVQTAEIISNELNINKSDIIIDDRINELDHGLLSGSKKGDKIHNVYMKEFNKLSKDPIKSELAFIKFDKIIEKKMKTESMEHIVKRLNSFYNMLPKNKKNIILVTHGGIVSSTLKVIFNILPAGDIKGDLSNGKNCTITCITRKKNYYQLLSLPNTLHLK
jgi:broad specificity phosphatase PhoE